MAHLTRTREVRGPGVAGIAVIAKPPPLRPPEYRIYELRADNERRQVYQDVLRTNKQALQRASFEIGTDKAIRRKAVENRVNSIMSQREAALEERRSKLRELLAAEEAQYTAQAIGQIPTSIEQMAAMRDRVRTLRDARETARLEFATQKLDEAWKSNCDSLRGARSRQDHMLIDEDRRAQIVEKEALNAEQAAIDQLYADLWESDRLAKEAREAADREVRHMRNAEFTDGLVAQMEELERNRHQEALLKEEAQRLRLEEMRLMEEEDRRHLGDKHQKQARFRRMLDRDASERAAFAAQTEAEEMSADLDLLEQIEREKQDSIAQAFAKKQKLAQEAHDYMIYLQNLREEKGRIDQFIDAACKEETRRVQSKQNQVWRMEKEKRRAMMTEVIATRKEQIAARQQAIADERTENAAEGRRIAADLEAFRAENDATELKKREWGASYGKQLDEQIQANETRRREEREADERAVAALKATQRATDDRVTQELASLLTISGRSTGL